MSFNPLNLIHAIINKKNGDVNERRTEHNQEGLRGVGNNSKGISRKIKHWSVICFRVEQRKQKDTKWDTFSLRTSYRKQSTQKRIKDNRRVQKNTKQNKIINIFLISDKKLDFVLKLDYNPIILKIKGLCMTNHIDLRKTATIDDIIDLEKKLLGIMGILDAFALSSEIGVDNNTEALALVRDSILDSIINQDIKMLKEKVSYMFGVCSDVYHGGEL